MPGWLNISPMRPGSHWSASATATPCIHNIEHTLLVTLAGHDILMGRTMLRTTTPADYTNFILACLTHDIGYVRGIVQGDDGDSYVADLGGHTIRLPRGSSDAALAPYHV